MLLWSLTIFDVQGGCKSAASAQRLHPKYCNGLDYVGKAHVLYAMNTAKRL